jgi:hypothetical protein
MTSTPFARWTFRLAAIYGLIVLLPLYGLEQRIGQDTPPPITHPEYFYGFIGAAVSANLLYGLISFDPRRYRPAMLIAVLAKLSFAFAVFWLALAGRVSGGPLAFAAIDFALGILFAIAFFVVVRR